MSINIQERVLDTLFDIAVEEIGVCDDMTKAYVQKESFIAGTKMAIALITGKEM